MTTRNHAGKAKAPVADKPKPEELLGIERLFDLEARMRRGISFEMIKERYRISDSAAFELIAKLKRELKATLEVSGRGRHRVYRSVGSPHCALDLPHDQVLPAYFLLRDATQRLFAPVMTGAHTLGKQIRTHVGETLESQVKRLESRIKLRFIGSPQGNPAIFSTFVKAMAENKTLLIEYQSAHQASAAVVAKAGADHRARAARQSGEEVPSPSNGLAGKLAPMRHVEPYAVFYARRALYAIVRPIDDSAKRQVLSKDWSHLRTFKFSRIARCELGTGTFSMPADFNIEEYLKDAWELVRTPGKARSTVVVDVAPEYAINIADTAWHPTQTREVLANGVHRLTFKVRGHDEMRYWILWLGEGATVVRPKSLRDEVKRLAKAIAAKYSR